MKTVVIDPGHGGIDPGAVGHGLKESDIALDISLRAADILAKRDDIMSLVTHEGKLDPRRHFELEDRCAYANRQKADVFVSVHCNAFGRASAHGHETYHFPGSVHGSRLARALNNAIKDDISEILPRGVKQARFLVLRDTAMPAALVETGFISNGEDAKLLGNEAFRQRYAEAIATGILNFFGLE